MRVHNFELREGKPRDVLDALPQDAAEAGRNVIPALGFNLTDLGNAERFVARYRDRVRYCPPRRKFLLWDGRRWAWDETGEATRLAKRTVRGVYGEAEVTADDDRRKALVKHARESEKAARIAALLTLVQSEEGIPVMPGELDADPWLFNVANGTLDLRTGELREHRREDLITKLAPVAHDPDAKLELWARFLEDITGGDGEYSAFLRRFAGYCLTGNTREKMLAFAFGPSNGGKSTLVDALAAAWGDYHRSADFSTWLEQSSTGGNRGDLVRLAGSRLVSSVEVQHGKRWDEAMLKRVTGGDELTASAKFEAEITFRATFKILLAANDAPSARADDGGFWPRMHRLPFAHVVSPEKRDPALRAQLADPAAGGPAVLAWAVRGCLEWQRDGLGTARAVERSTAAYRDEVDVVGRFLSECCAFEDWDEVRVSREDIRRALEHWCSEQGMRRQPSARDVAARLRERGAIDGRSNGARVWKRVRLLGPDEEPGTAGSDRDTIPQSITSPKSSDAQAVGVGVVYVRREPHADHAGVAPDEPSVRTSRFFEDA